MLNSLFKIHIKLINHLVKEGISRSSSKIVWSKDFPLGVRKIFLFEAKNMLIEHGFQIANIDCTIILQSPKVGPYISKIRKNISKMLELNEKKVLKSSEKHRK